jgi:hypothetical protein
MRDCHSPDNSASKNVSNSRSGGKPLEHLPAKNKKRLRRNNNTDSVAEDSAMEDDAGGSSQDQYESDFINDDGREEIDATKARRLKKGQIDSSEEDEFIAN